MNKETMTIICNDKVLEFPITPLLQTDRIVKLNGVWGILHMERESRENEK